MHWKPPQPGCICKRRQPDDARLQGGSASVKEIKHLEQKWKILCGLLGPFVDRIFRFEHENSAPEGPFILISNHVTNFDPILVGVCFPERPLCIVASEHLFRKGFMTRAIRWLFDPIAKRKGTSGMETAMACMRRLRAGRNICIFAEGETTWNGLTQPVLPSTGSLARMSGATLVTFRLEGGYLTAPRWAAKIRRGRMRGSVIGTYSPETLKAMKPEEINEIINRDLFEDAWKRQESENVAYKSANPAENIEVALFMCPKCKRLGTIYGKGRRVKCSCGLDVEYTAYGRFDPPQPFETMAQWDEWQHRALESGELCREGSALQDDGLILSEIIAGHGQKEIARGSLAFDPDGLRFGQLHFPFCQISNMALLQRRKLVFTHEDRYFEVSRKKPLCMRKYLAAWQISQKKTA